jgi:tetratricopeptide (TPR) repeat protein
VVDFTGRAEEIAALAAWCDEAGAAPVRLLTGPAGVGKTRLALRLLEVMATRGWRCGWVGRETETAAVARARSVAGRALLVVDQAAARPGLLDMLRAVAAGDGWLRVLLIERSAGLWWERLGAGDPAVHGLVTAAGSAGDTVGPVLDTYLLDEELVRVAVTCFARELGVPPPERVSIASDTRRARVLDWHAAALVAVLDSRDAAPAETVTVALSGALGQLLAREERCWLAAAHEQGLLGGPAAMAPSVARQLVAAGALLGAASEQEALALLSRVPGAPQSIAVAHWLRSQYPPPAGSGEWLGTLLPDRLAEQLVAAELGQSATLAQQCLSGLTERQLQRALLLLAHASGEQEAAARLLAQLLPKLAAPREILVTIADALPYPCEPLAAVYARVTQRLADSLPAGTPTAERACWRDRLAMTLAQAGHAAGAAAAEQEAIAQFRGLAGPGAGQFLPELGASLARLGIYLSGLGRVAEAVTATGESIAIRRELAALSPERYLPDLATSLSIMVRSLAELGRAPEALPLSEEAVSICRELAAESSELYRPDLARALVNLGATLSELHRPDEALPVAEETVSLYRELAMENPDLYRPDLARTLANLGAICSNSGRQADSLPFTQEAVAIRRELAAASPARHQPDLAHSLANLSAALCGLGRPADGVPPLAEAAAVYRELARSSPQRYRPELARSLTSLCALLAGLGEDAQALPVAEEAVATYRELAAVGPGTHHAGLAESLAGLAAVLTRLGRVAEAHEARQAAASLR